MSPRPGSSWPENSLPVRLVSYTPGPSSVPSGPSPLLPQEKTLQIARRRSREGVGGIASCLLRAGLSVPIRRRDICMLMQGCGMLAKGVQAASRLARRSSPLIAAAGCFQGDARPPVHPPARSLRFIAELIKHRKALSNKERKQYLLAK